jgi:hypothetical protein
LHEYITVRKAFRPVGAQHGWPHVRKIHPVMKSQGAGIRDISGSLFLEGYSSASVAPLNVNVG